MIAASFLVAVSRAVLAVATIFAWAAFVAASAAGAFLLARSKAAFAFTLAAAVGGVDLASFLVAVSRANLAAATIFTWAAFVAASATGAFLLARSKATCALVLAAVAAVDSAVAVLVMVSKDVLAAVILFTWSVFVAAAAATAFWPARTKAAVALTLAAVAFVDSAVEFPVMVSKTVLAAAIFFA